MSRREHFRQRRLGAARPDPPAEHHEITPIAWATVAWSDHGRYWALTIPSCPFCRKRHHHGGGSDAEPDLGSRRPHCLSGPHPDYVVIETPGSAEERAELGRGAKRGAPA